MKKLGVIILSLVLLALIPNQVLADNTSTLREIKKTIKTHEVQLAKAQTNLIEFKNRNGALADFFSEDLNDFQKSNINESLEKYKSISEEYIVAITQNLDIEARDTLIEEFLAYQDDFLKSLIVYVPVENKQAYLDYIASENNYQRKIFDLKQKINTTKIKKAKKEEQLLAKVSENQQKLEEKIYEIAKNKIIEKINEIKISEDFKKLSDNDKLLMFEALLAHTINQKNTIGEKLDNPKDSQKYKIYFIMESVIRGEVENFKNK